MYRPMGTIRFSVGCYCCSCCLSMGTTSVQYLNGYGYGTIINNTSPLLLLCVFLYQVIGFPQCHFFSFSLLLFILVSLQSDSLFVFDSAIRLCTSSSNRRLIKCHCQYNSFLFIIIVPTKSATASLIRYTWVAVKLSRA